MAWSGPLEAATDELAPGTELDGRFRIQSLLGEGGMGVVYLADDLERRHEVALKILIPRYRGRPEREQRLLDEAVHAERLEAHPGLPRLYDSGRLADLDDCPYVAWQVVQGRQLNALLALRSALVPKVAALWARQLAEAIQALHRAATVHRDVSVDNVFVEDPDGDAKVWLIDLSHAALVPQPDAPQRRRLTRETEVPGAHRYMSPEQAKAAPPHPKMDVFAFGVLLHEMLTGTNPFGHVQERERFIELQRAGELEVPRIDRRVYPQVPESLVDLVEACTRNDAKTRIDIDEVLVRLNQAITDMSAPLPFPDLSARDDAAASEPLGDAQAAANPSSDVHVDAVVSRSRTRLMVVTILLVALAAIGVALLGSEPEGEHDERTMDGALEPPRESASPNPPRAQAVPEEPDTTESPSTVDETDPARPAVRPVPATATSPDDAKSKRPTASKRRRASKSHNASSIPDHRAATSHDADRCTQAVAAAREAIPVRAWSGVLSNTLDASCFTDRNEWTSLRIQALSESGRYDDCIALGNDSLDATVRRFVQICRARKEAP